MTDQKKALDDNPVTSMRKYLEAAGWQYEWIPNYPDTYPTMAGVRIWKHGCKTEISHFIDGQFTPFKEIT